MIKLLSLAVICPALLFAQGPLPADYPVAPIDDTSADTPSTSASVNAVPAPLTVRQKVNRRAWRLIEPVALINSAFGAGIEQWRDVPPQWGQGAEGFAKRFGSAEGYTAAHNGIALGFDVAFHLDPRYRRMPDGTVKQRIWNAVSQTILANKDSGGRMINVSEIAGNFGAGFVTNTWEPHGYNTTGDALVRGALGLAYHTGRNVMREFLPDLLHRGKQQPAYAYAGAPSPSH
jgi:hypothetical protein